MQTLQFALHLFGSYPFLAGKTSDSDSILQLENRSPSNHIFIYMCVSVCAWICPEVEQISRTVTFKGEFQCCPSSKFLKGWWDLVGHPGLQIWQEASEGTQTDCFLGLEPLKKEESITRLRYGFCLVEVWGFHQVCVQGCMCVCMYSNRKYGLETNCKNSASE